MQLRDSKTKVIGGVEYKVVQLGAVTGRKVFRRLMAVVGSSLEKADKAGALAAIGAVLADLSDEDVTFFCDVFGPLTEVSLPDGRKPFLTAEIFDNHFAGKYEDMIGWLLFCFVVNFSSFFQKMGLNLEGAQLLS